MTLATIGPNGDSRLHTTMPFHQAVDLAIERATASGVRQTLRRSKTSAQRWTVADVESVSA